MEIFIHCYDPEGFCSVLCDDQLITRRTRVRKLPVAETLLAYSSCMGLERVRDPKQTRRFRSAEMRKWNLLIIVIEML